MSTLAFFDFSALIVLSKYISHDTNLVNKILQHSKCQISNSVDKGNEKKISPQDLYENDVKGQLKNTSLLTEPCLIELKLMHLERVNDEYLESEYHPLSVILNNPFTYKIYSILLDLLYSDDIKSKLFKKSKNIGLYMVISVTDLMYDASKNKGEASTESADLFHAKYCISDKINSGGFGTVWKIRDDDQKCVKIMSLGKNKSTQEKRLKSVIREYNHSKLAFANSIVNIELYVDDIHALIEPKAYLILPFFDGKDMFDLIDDDDYFRNISFNMMLNIFHKMLIRLKCLHYDRNILHSDLKPENVMICRKKNKINQTMDDIDDIDVELIDYGIAKSLRKLSSDHKFLRAKGHFGTKGYVAPELMNENKYNRKTDVFSAGIVLYNMVTECCLFEKGMKYWQLSNQEYYRHLKKKFKCIRKQEKILDILYSCLAFDPLERLTVPQLIEKYFSTQGECVNERESFVEDNRSPISPCKENIEFSYLSSPSVSGISSIDSDQSFMMEESRNYKQELIFKAQDEIEAWRWDSYHNKWRCRGIGSVYLYYIREMNITKLVFDDTKYDKPRLLQYVDHNQHCELVNDAEVEWSGKDYSMDTENPVISNWKLRFNHDFLSLNTKQFIHLFNNYTNRPSKHRQSFIC